MAIIMPHGKVEKAMLLLILLSYFEPIKTEPTVIPLSKSLKFIMESFVPAFDSVYIQDIRLVSPDENIYDCVIAKDIKTFFIDVVIRQIGEERELYKLSNMEGCVFLSNTLFSKIFHGFYENLVVNRSEPLKCPIKAGSYLFRTAFNKNVLPQIHPMGNFSLNLRLKSHANDKIMLDLKWLYRLAKG